MTEKTMKVKLAHALKKGGVLYAAGTTVEVTEADLAANPGLVAEKVEEKAEEKGKK